ncbi:MAG: CdvA-like protein [Candidatus Bathyarchaeia archaeon]
MTLTVEQIGRYLGQSLEDPMGRPSGKLVGLTADIKDEVQAVQVALGDGGVAEYPISSVRVIDGHPIILEAWRVEAEDLKREHDIVKRRRQALDLLLRDGDIDQTEYNQLRNSYEDINKETIAKREKVVETLKEEVAKLEQQIKGLQTALTNNKMLYTAAEIDENTYHSVTGSIRAGLEIARKERKDIDNTKESLQTIDNLDASITTTETSAPPKIPDVVVIKMRESA